MTDDNKHLTQAKDEAGQTASNNWWDSIQSSVSRFLHDDDPDRGIAELLEEQKADVLLEAQFTFQRTPYGERVLTVTGFPAVYKNFRKATKGDLDAIKAIPANEKTTYNRGGGLLGVFGK